MTDNGSDDSQSYDSEDNTSDTVSSTSSSSEGTVESDSDAEDERQRHNHKVRLAKMGQSGMIPQSAPGRFGGPIVHAGGPRSGAIGGDAGAVGGGGGAIGGGGGGGQYYYSEYGAPGEVRSVTTRKQVVMV